MKELIIVVLALMGLGVVIFGLICVWYFVTEKKYRGEENEKDN